MQQLGFDTEGGWKGSYQMKMKRCSKGDNCRTGNPEQPISEFISLKNRRETSQCRTCRDYSSVRGRVTKAKKDKNDHINGYGLNHPRREFILPPGCLLANRPPQFAQNGYFGVNGLGLLTAPNGQPVVKVLGSGEISWVLA